MSFFDIECYQTLHCTLENNICYKNKEFEVNMNAKEYFYSGYNCAQSVALAFADELGLDKEFIARAVSGFGGGIGRLRETCGAVSGMVFVLNLLYGYSKPNDTDIKAEYYQRVREVVEEYRKEVGSINCKEILKNPEVGGRPEDRTTEYYQKRPCPDLCLLAENILRKYIAKNDYERK